MNAEHGEENVQVKPHAYVHRKKTLQGADTYLIQIEYPIISDDHIFFSGIIRFRLKWKRYLIQPKSQKFLISGRIGRQIRILYTDVLCTALRNICFSFGNTPL